MRRSKKNEKAVQKYRNKPRLERNGARKKKVTEEEKG